MNGSIPRAGALSPGTGEFSLATTPGMRAFGNAAENRTCCPAPRCCLTHVISWPSTLVGGGEAFTSLACAAMFMVTVSWPMPVRSYQPGVKSSSRFSPVAWNSPDCSMLNETSKVSPGR